MAGMMLADMGAEVIRIDRSAEPPPDAVQTVSFRGKKSVALDLKNAAGIEALLRIAAHADALIEGFRPGVTERLGVGPDVCLQRNPKLVYGRMTGWGQDGPLAQSAGHDINYIALAGALHAIGRKGESPVPPLNLIGDMGGGGMLLAFGVVCAVFEAQRSGRGQVVDAAMVDGTALQMWMLPGLRAAGAWNAEERGVNLLDGGAPYYDTYETRDGRFLALGALEPQFYATLLELMGLDAAQFSDRDRSRWPEMREAFAGAIRAKSRDEWCRIFEGTDACVAPVLSFVEAAAHPHIRARGTYLEIDGLVQPAPAPRFSRTAPQVSHGPHPIGADGSEVLADAGFSISEIRALRDRGVLL
jgi:alpha-methylacyl-CoA racemase